MEKFGNITLYNLNIESINIYHRNRGIETIKIK
jgi:hypothetical protein